MLQTEVEKERYSPIVVEVPTRVFSLDPQMAGKSEKVMIHPESDLALDGSVSEKVLDQLPQ